MYVSPYELSPIYVVSTFLRAVDIAVLGIAVLGFVSARLARFLFLQAFGDKSKCPYKNDRYFFFRRY